MFAACHNQFNIVRLLMQYSNQRQHHDKKSMQHWLDANGNNVLHMMVISGLKVCDYSKKNDACNCMQHTVCVSDRCEGAAILLPTRGDLRYCQATNEFSLPFSCILLSSFMVLVIDLLSFMAY